MLDHQHSLNARPRVPSFPVSRKNRCGQFRRGLLLEHGGTGGSVHAVHSVPYSIDIRVSVAQCCEPRETFASSPTGLMPINSNQVLIMTGGLSNRRHRYEDSSVKTCFQAGQRSSSPGQRALVARSLPGSGYWTEGT